MSNQVYDLIIIDDESTVTDIFQQYILWKYPGWRFMTFNNAEVLYSAINNHQIVSNVWIIDMMMPVKNGADIAAIIRERQGDSPILLAYTALEKVTLETQEAYRHGLSLFNHVLNKRENFVSILSLVEVWIENEG